MNLSIGKYRYKHIATETGLHYHTVRKLAKEHGWEVSREKDGAYITVTDEVINGLLREMYERKLIQFVEPAPTASTEQHKKTDSESLEVDPVQQYNLMEHVLDALRESNTLAESLKSDLEHSNVLNSQMKDELATAQERSHELEIKLAVSETKLEERTQALEHEKLKNIEEFRYWMILNRQRDGVIIDSQVSRGAQKQANSGVLGVMSSWRNKLKGNSD